MVSRLFFFAPAACHLARSSPQPSIFGRGRNSELHPSAHSGKGRPLPLVRLIACKLSANDAQIFPSLGGAALGHHSPPDRPRMLLRALPTHLGTAARCACKSLRAPAFFPLQMMSDEKKFSACYWWRHRGACRRFGIG